MTLVLATTLALPAQAHSTDEVETWMDAWIERAEEGLEMGMLSDLNRFMSAHRAHFYSVQVPISRYTIGYSVEQWRPLVSQHFEDVETALCLMEHESRGNPNAKNPTSSARGLFQILGSLWAPHFGIAKDDLYDPELNIRLAAEIYEMQGWWAWSPYQRGLCR